MLSGQKLELWTIAGLMRWQSIDIIKKDGVVYVSFNFV